ncbi:MAG: polyphosphate kinase 1, partial [Lentisphaeria bacterium]|nr:polyphosphate kinase 1 [Lentisphaeria bacterium]
MNEQSPYLNRELSWLEFNQRVLDEAANPEVPLLERLKFLAITASNLDEFFMVRVGGLRLLIEEGSTRPDPSGLTPRQQLAAVRQRVRDLCACQERIYREELEPALAAAGIRRVGPAVGEAGQDHVLARLFDGEIGLIVTPAAVPDPKRFPLVANLGLHLAVRLRPAAADPKRQPRYAVVPLGGPLARVLSLSAETGRRYILLEDLVRAFADRLFPGERIAEAVAFRVTRNAGMSVDEDGAFDLLAEMEGVLDARTFSGCIRLEIEASASKVLTRFLTRCLAVAPDDVYPSLAPVGLGELMELAGIEAEGSLRYPGMPPLAPAAVDPSQPMFPQIAKRDILLCHPYESFEPVLRFLREAAADPDVLAIKQVLYRVSKDSPIVEALREAAAAGKYVTALVEVKARFDEARNIDWARRLEMAGVQVIYGVKGLKTHAKICMVMRREPRGIVRYLHFGTGNYNERTAKLYSDISLLTCAEDLGADASAFFNAVAGYSTPQSFRRLAVAPIGLRERLLELIDAEAERRRQGQKARIVAKMNSLVDTEVIDALYRASQAGVKIRLNIRGICCLRPGVKGLSENIEVVSIVDRFLEHARIMVFHHGGDERVFISSADWMPRNLRGRVELLVPVEDPDCRRRLTAILDTYFRDNCKARRLLADGSYKRVSAGRVPVRAQYALHDLMGSDVLAEQRRRKNVFEPHRSQANGG